MSLSEPHPVVFKVLFGNFAESQSKDFAKEAIDEEESAEYYGYLSDSDLEDDEDEKVASFKRKDKSKGHPFDPFAIPGEDERIICEEHGENIGKGKVVKIPDMAFVTWVRIGSLSETLLMLLQVPSLFNVSLHGCDKVRTIWVRRESQIAQCGNRHNL